MFPSHCRSIKNSSLPTGDTILRIEEKNEVKHFVVAKAYFVQFIIFNHNSGSVSSSTHSYSGSSTHANIGDHLKLLHKPVNNRNI
jgi:hypothetical protein